MQITTAQNGYVVATQDGVIRIASTVEELCSHITELLCGAAPKGVKPTDTESDKSSDPTADIEAENAEAEKAAKAKAKAEKAAATRAANKAKKEAEAKAKAEAEAEAKAKADAEAAAGDPVDDDLGLDLDEPKPAKVVTLKDVKDEVSAMAVAINNAKGDDSGKKVAKEILEKHGAKKFDQLDEGAYADVISAARAMKASVSV